MWKEELRPAASLEEPQGETRLQKVLRSIRALARVRKGERSRPVPSAAVPTGVGPEVGKGEGRGLEAPCALYITRPTFREGCGASKSMACPSECGSCFCGDYSLCVLWYKKKMASAVESSGKKSSQWLVMVVPCVTVGFPQASQ
jgi:hypothetical protein